MDENKEKDRLETVSGDDDWLEAFIQDTEEHWMLHAPARLREDTLSKVRRIRFSKRVQLISYSVKVCTAAAAALFILFTTPVFLQPSVYPGVLTEAPAPAAPRGPDDGTSDRTGGRRSAGADGRIHSRTGGAVADGIHSPIGSAIADEIDDGMAWTRQTLQEGFRQITGSIHELSNEFFPGR